MADGGYDFAVFGASALACLTAGLLATEHGKRVCLVGATPSPYRLARRFDLSVSALTRPESWALLKRASAETLKLLSGMGKGLFERVDPVFIGETPATIDMLGHMRHVASGSGFAVERVHERALVPSGAACRIRDAALLVGSRLGPALDGWLSRHEVRSIPANVGATLRRDGSALLTFAGSSFEAATAVLADDSAILEHLSADERARLGLDAVPAVSVLTEPSAALGAPYLHYIDRDVAVAQRGSKAELFAMVGGHPAEALARLGTAIGPLTPLRRVGQAVFRTIRTADGAPLIGSARGSKTVLVAGFGSSAAFLAPALSRYLAGAAGDEEAAWFGARDGARVAARAAVADFALPILPDRVN